MVWTHLDSFGSFIDPWRSLERLNRAASSVLPAAASEFPAVNLWADGNSAIATAELPGIDPKTVDISVSGRVLTLRAGRNPVEAGEEESYHRRERWYGQFSRTIELPYNIDAAKVEAKFTRGVLHLTLPRTEEEKPRKIAITTE
jgi:HSP20 family protein